MYGLKERSYNELITILFSEPEIEDVVLYSFHARGDYRHASNTDLSLKGVGLNRHILSVLNDKLRSTSRIYHISITLTF